MSLAFTDWRAIKAALGMSDVTSDDPYDQRTELIRQAGGLPGTSEFAFSAFVAQSGATPAFVDLWGFDTADLDWEAAVLTSIRGQLTILRFRDDYDLTRLAAIFDERSFATESLYGVTLRSHEKALAEDWFSELPGAAFGFLNTAFVDEHTLLLGSTRGVVERALEGRGALLAGPQATPLGNAVASLEHANAGHLVLQPALLCDPLATAEGDEARERIATSLAAAGGLHTWSVLGIGYGTRTPAFTRVVLAYDDAADATDDLPARRQLAEEGFSGSLRRPLSDLFSVADATSDSVLRLDFGPPSTPLSTGPTPPLVRTLYAMAVRHDLIFAACPL